jgi:hypothetical protein
MNKQTLIALIIILIPLSMGFIYLMTAFSGQQTPIENKSIKPTPTSPPEVSSTTTTTESPTPQPPLPDRSQSTHLKITATLEVPSGGVYAAQITYQNLAADSIITSIDPSTGETWTWTDLEGNGRLGVVYPAGENGTFKATLERENETVEVSYTVVPGQPSLGTFLVETWALKNNKIIEKMAPGDRVSLTVQDTQESFTLIATEEDFDVIEGKETSDIEFLIYRQEDLMEFVNTKDLGATIRTMIWEKKLAVQLKTGDLFKLSRFVNLAIGLGVIER